MMMMMMMIALENCHTCCQEFVKFSLKQFNEKNFIEFFNVIKFREILHYSLFFRILESSNFMSGVCLNFYFLDQLKCALVKKNLTVKC